LYCTCTWPFLREVGKEDETHVSWQAQWASGSGKYGGNNRTERLQQELSQKLVTGAILDFLNRATFRDLPAHVFSKRALDMMKDL